MSNQESVLDVFPVETERLTAAAFLKLVKENPGMIKSSMIVNPAIGKAGFGSFQVIYTRPLYRSLPSLQLKARRAAKE